MKCKFCGAEMVLDDKDFNFKGNYDNYWFCPKCENSCVEMVRFSKTIRIFWESDNNDDSTKF